MAKERNFLNLEVQRFIIKESEKNKSVRQISTRITGRRGRIDSRGTWTKYHKKQSQITDFFAKQK